MKRDPRKPTGRPRAASKKTAAKKLSLGRNALARKTRKRKRNVRGEYALVEVVPFEPRGLGARSGGQSGDLQGLSGTETAAPESVEELLEEGNAFEAEFVRGVEDAESSDEIEVGTHEVPEDDVPEEYQFVEQ